MFCESTAGVFDPESLTLFGLVGAEKRYLLLILCYPFYIATFSVRSKSSELGNGCIVFPQSL